MSWGMWPDEELKNCVIGEKEVEVVEVVLVSCPTRGGTTPWRVTDRWTGCLAPV